MDSQIGLLNYNLLVTNKKGNDMETIAKQLVDTWERRYMAAVKAHKKSEKMRKELLSDVCKETLNNRVTALENEVKELQAANLAARNVADLATAFAQKLDAQGA